MRLSEIIISLERPVAYFPGLKRLTNSTVATIFLCQCLYWSDKTGKGDGWFWKSVADWNKETGLTYNEQVTARTKLKEINVLWEREDGFEHKIYYKLDLDTFNNLYEAIITKENIDEIPVVEEKKMFDLPKNHGKDLVDAYVDLMEMPGVKKSQVTLAIESQMKVRLNINPSGNRWQNFISFAADRWLKDKQHINKFIDWVLLNEKPSFYSADRFQMLWPQAFIVKPLDNKPFTVVQLAKVEEVKKIVAPMPKNLGR